MTLDAPYAAFPQDYPTGHVLPHVFVKKNAVNGALTPEKYGTQSIRTWSPTDIDKKQVLDSLPNEFLWRAGVIGSNVKLDVTWGSGGTNRLENVRLPFVGYIPGQLNIQASKLDSAAAASCTVTLTTVAGIGEQKIRTFIDATGGAVALLTTGTRYTALAASTLTVAGVGPFAVAAGATLPLIHPATVNTGSGILEHSL